MKRFLGCVPILLVLLVSVASAQDAPEHPKGGVGFHNFEAPLGGRWWFSPKMAIDANLGIGSQDDPGTDESLSNFALDIGFVWALKSFDKMHLILRPGYFYQSDEEVIDNGPPVEKDSNVLSSLSVELEAELFLTSHFSVSAASGIAFGSFDPAGPADSFSAWQTTGSNWTTLGFHAYFLGGN